MKQNITPVIQAVRKAVADLHAGKIHATILPTTKKSDIRWTPSFVKGRSPESSESRPYTCLAIGRIIGSTQNAYTAKGKKYRKASEAVETALLLLSLLEQGVIHEESFDTFSRGENRMTLNDLIELSRKLRKAA